MLLIGGAIAALVVLVAVVVGWVYLRPIVNFIRARNVELKHALNTYRPDVQYTLANGVLRTSGQTEMRMFPLYLELEKQTAGNPTARAELLRQFVCSLPTSEGSGANVSTSVAVLGLFASEDPGAVFWAKTVWWHLGTTLQGVPNLRVEPISLEERQLGGPPSRLLAPVPEDQAIDLARQANTSHAIFGELSLGESIAVTLRRVGISSGLEFEFRESRPLALVGQLLDEVARWALKTQAQTPPVHGRFEGAPTEAIERFHQALFAGKRLIDEGSPWAQILRITGTQMVELLEQYPTLTFVRDALVSDCAQAAEPDAIEVAKDLLKKASQALPHDEEIAALLANLQAS